MEDKGTWEAPASYIYIYNKYIKSAGCLHSKNITKGQKHYTNHFYWKYFGHWGGGGRGKTCLAGNMGIIMYLSTLS